MGSARSKFSSDNAVLLQHKNNNNNGATMNESKDTRKKPSCRGGRPPKKQDEKVTHFIKIGLTEKQFKHFYNAFKGRNDRVNLSSCMRKMIVGFLNDGRFIVKNPSEIDDQALYELKRLGKNINGFLINSSIGKDYSQLIITLSSTQQLINQMIEKIK